MTAVETFAMGRVVAWKTMCVAERICRRPDGGRGVGLSPFERAFFPGERRPAKRGAAFLSDRRPACRFERSPGPGDAPLFVFGRSFFPGGRPSGKRGGPFSFLDVHFSFLDVHLEKGAAPFCFWTSIQSFWTFIWKKGRPPFCFWTSIQSFWASIWKKGYITFKKGRPVFPANWPILLKMTLISPLFA